MANLKPVTVGARVKLDVAIERQHVHLVKSRRHSCRVDRAGVFDGLLQDQARCVPTGRVIRGIFIVGSLVGAGEVVARRPKPIPACGLRGSLSELHLGLPLAGSDDAEGSVAQLGKVVLRRGYQ